MEADREVLCGSKGRHQGERSVWRGGERREVAVPGGFRRCRCSLLAVDRGAGGTAHIVPDNIAYRAVRAPPASPLTPSPMSSGPAARPRSGSAVAVKGYSPQLARCGSYPPSGRPALSSSANQHATRPSAPCAERRRRATRRPRRVDGTSAARRSCAPRRSLSCVRRSATRPGPRAPALLAHSAARRSTPSPLVTEDHGREWPRRLNGHVRKTRPLNEGRGVNPGDTC